MFCWDPPYPTIPDPKMQTIYKRFEEFGFKCADEFYTTIFVLIDFYFNVHPVVNVGDSKFNFVNIYCSNVII